MSPKPVLWENALFYVDYFYWSSTDPPKPAPRHINAFHTQLLNQKRIYEQMKKEAMAILNGKVTTTMTVLTQLMRLHQITCGHFTADDGSTQAIKNNRITELMDVLEETEGKAIIWAHYQYDVQTIIEAIKSTIIFVAPNT